jgi:hypothetical protein
MDPESQFHSVNVFIRIIFHPSFDPFKANTKVAAYVYDVFADKMTLHRVLLFDGTSPLISDSMIIAKQLCIRCAGTWVITCLTTHGTSSQDQRPFFFLKWVLQPKPLTPGKSLSRSSRLNNGRPNMWHIAFLRSLHIIHGFISKHMSDWGHIGLWIRS